MGGGDALHEEADAVGGVPGEVGFFPDPVFLAQGGGFDEVSDATEVIEGRFADRAAGKVGSDGEGGPANAGGGRTVRHPGRHDGRADESEKPANGPGIDGAGDEDDGAADTPGIYPGAGEGGGYAEGLTDKVVSGTGHGDGEKAVEIADDGTEVVDFAGDGEKASFRVGHGGGIGDHFETIAAELPEDGTPLPVLWTTISMVTGWMNWSPSGSRRMAKSGPPSGKASE